MTKAAALSWWQRLLSRAQERYRGSAVEEFATRLSQLGFEDTILIFGALFLLSALPLIILLSSFASRRVEDDLSRHLGLNAQAARVVDGLFASPRHLAASAVVLAFVFAVGGSISVAGSVQRIYERTFEVPHRRRWNLPRLLIWVAVLLAWLGADGAISTATRHVPGGTVLDGLGMFAVTTVFFWWSMHYLLAGRIKWRFLACPAVATGVLWIGLDGVAAAYFSGTINTDSKLYGSIGVVFSLLTWFVAIAAVVVLGALIGDILQRRVLARRGGQSLLQEPSLPPPAREPRPT